jgi:hypothetical protein
VKNASRLWLADRANLLEDFADWNGGSLWGAVVRDTAGKVAFPGNPG